METSLTDRLAMLREINNLSSKSSVPAPDFPLVSLLQMYTAHHRYCYIGWEGRYEYLVRWLAPIDMSVLDSIPERTLHWYEQSYEVIRLSKLLGCSQSKLYDLCKELYDK